jgi:hypothetical protein
MSSLQTNEEIFGGHYDTLEVRQASNAFFDSLFAVFDNDFPENYSLVDVTKPPEKTLRERWSTISKIDIPEVIEELAFLHSKLDDIVGEICDEARSTTQQSLDRATRLNKKLTAARVEARQARAEARQARADVVRYAKLTQDALTDMNAAKNVARREATRAIKARRAYKILQQKNINTSRTVSRDKHGL